MTELQNSYSVRKSQTEKSTHRAMKSENMQTNLQWQKADQWFPGDGGGDGERQKEWITMGQKKIVTGDGYVCYLNCGDDIMGIYICQNLLNCTRQICAIYYMSIRPQRSC